MRALDHITNKRTLIFAWGVCVLAALFYLYEYSLRVSPSIMTPQVMSAYHLNAGAFGNLSATYYYIYAPMQLVVGLLMDCYGPRRLLTMAVLVCGAGAYLFASTHYLFVAEIGRFLIGFGSAFAFVGVLKIATIWLPPHRFALITGITMSMGMIGGIAGDVVLTSLLNHHGWKLTHYFVADVGVVLALLIFLVVRDKGRPDGVVSAMQTLPSVSEVFTGIISLIKNRQIWINGLVGLLLYLPLSGFAESWQIPFLNQSINFGHDRSAMAASMVFLGWAVGAPFMGWLSDALRQRRLLLTIGAAISAILISFVIYVPHLGSGAIFGVFFVFGFFASVQIIVFPIGREISSQKLSGTAIALTNSIVMLAGVSVWVIGAMLDHFWLGEIVNNVHVYSLQTYQVALSILPAGLVLAVFLTFFIDETYCKLKP